MLRIKTFSLPKVSIRSQWVPNPQFGVRGIHKQSQMNITQTVQRSVTLFKKPTALTTIQYLARFTSQRKVPSSQREMPEWMKEELERAEKRQKKDKKTVPFDPEMQEELARGPDDVNVFDNLVLSLFFLFLAWNWGLDTIHKLLWPENRAFMCFDYPHLKSPKYGINDPYVCFKHYVLDQRTEETLAFHAVKFYPHRKIPNENDRWRIAFNPTNPAEFTWLWETDTMLYSTLALKAAVMLVLGRKLVKQYPLIYQQYDRRKYFKKLFNFGD